jgi:hypothetical protein
MATRATCADPEHKRGPFLKMLFEVEGCSAILATIKRRCLERHVNWWIFSTFYLK